MDVEALNCCHLCDPHTRLTPKKHRSWYNGTDRQARPRHEEVEGVGGNEGEGRAIPADYAFDTGSEEPGLAATTLGRA